MRQSSKTLNQFYQALSSLKPYSQRMLFNSDSLALEGDILSFFGTARKTQHNLISYDAHIPIQLVGGNRVGKMIFLWRPPFQMNQVSKSLKFGFSGLSISLVINYFQYYPFENFKQAINEKTQLIILFAQLIKYQKVTIKEKPRMKSLILRNSFNSTDAVANKKQLSTFYKTVATIDVNKPVRQKITTFTRWNVQDSLPKNKKKSHHRNQLVRDNTANSMFRMVIEQLMQKTKQKEKKDKDKKILVIDELQGVKTERRQRFKRIQNPMHIIQYYISKEGFAPNPEENLLLGRIIDLKQKIDGLQPFDLQVALHHIIKTMNIAVDINQTQFLILIVIMTGEICYQAKELKTAFFFFTQGMVASTCTRNWTTKLEALIYMGKICMDILEYQKAIIFFKKSLQYAWKTKDGQTELKIFDLLGQCYYYEGNSASAQYYHTRYILGQNQNAESAVRRISFQMLREYEKTLENTEKQNLNQLFLEYLSLPITNFSFFPPTKVEKTYDNYSFQTSPRKNRRDVHFDYKQLPEASVQINKLLKQSNDFQTQIPSPDLHRNFIAVHKYGKVRKDVQFQQSNDFHKIVGVKTKQLDKSLLKLPVQEQAAKILQQKSNPYWWEDIVAKSKKQRNQKLGSIRNKTYKRHLSYHSNEKKKVQSLKKQSINQSFNKTILNWIDPPKK